MSFILLIKEANNKQIILFEYFNQIVRTTVNSNQEPTACIKIYKRTA